MRRPPRIEHVKHVGRLGKWYSYFNTGQKRDGKPIYAPMPPYGSVGFFDSYGAFKAARSKRQAPLYAVASLADDFEKSARFASKAANTRKLYSAQLGKIRDAWGKFPVNDLQPADVRLVLESGVWNAGTYNTVLGVLGVLYTWGRKNDKTTLHPTKDIDRMQGGSHEPWPEDVLEAALQADDPLVRLATHLLYFTGQRIGDVCKIRWGDIRDNVLHVVPEKTRRFDKRLYVPILSELQAELDRTPKRGLTILHGYDQRVVRAALQDFTEGLGAATVPHGLRKNAVNALLEAGCTIAEVASITGQTYQVVEHYAARVNNRKLGQAAMLKFETRRGTNREEGNGGQKTA